MCREIDQNNEGFFSRWNHGMSDALQRELFETLRQLGFSELNNADDEIVCFCP